MWCVIDRDIGSFISEHTSYAEAESAMREYERNAELNQRFAVVYVDGNFGVN